MTMKNFLHNFSKIAVPPNGQEILKKNIGDIRGIFMHVHKCAGTSLITSIIKSDTVISCAARPGNFPGKTGRELIPDSLWDKAFKFTFVRNPYDRIYSAYSMFKLYPCFKPLFPSFLDFLQFLEWTDLKNHQVSYYTDEPTYALKIENIIHHCSSYLNPKYHINEMNFIGRLENIDLELTKLRRQHHIEIPNLPKLNISKRKNHYKDAYGSKEIKIVSRIYAEDLEKFRYLF
jgi:hypothetical protein